MYVQILSLSILRLQFRHERQKSIVLRLGFAAIPDLNPSGDCEAREAVSKQCETVQEL